MQPSLFSIFVCFFVFCFFLPFSFFLSLKKKKYLLTVHQMLPGLWLKARKKKKTHSSIFSPLNQLRPVFWLHTQVLSSFLACHWEKKCCDNASNPRAPDGKGKGSGCSGEQRVRARALRQTCAEQGRGVRACEQVGSRCERILFFFSFL